jgi:hypothetical protein
MPDPKQEILAILKKHAIISEMPSDSGKKEKFVGQIIINVNDGGITSLFANRKVF